MRRTMTRVVPSSCARFAAITRAISLFNGLAQRWNSYIDTSFAATRTTSCGWSTDSGTVTGPTAMLAADAPAAGAGAVAAMVRV